MKTVLHSKNLPKCILSPALVIFLWLLIYGFAVVCRFHLPKISETAYIFYCVDYSMGFCSKFLPGAVYNLIVSEPTVLSATVYNCILLLIFYAVLAVMLQKWLNNLPAPYLSTAYRLLALYLTGSFTFAIFLYEPGMLDVSWVYLSVIFIIMLDNKYIRFFLPLLFILALMVHNGAIVCYVPFWALLLLYKILTEENKKEKKIWSFLFFFSCFAAVLSFLYFAVYDRQNVVYDIETFHSILRKRGSTYFNYYDYALYFSENTYREICEQLDIDPNTIPYLIFSSENHVMQLILNIVNQAVIHIYLFADKYKAFVIPNMIANLVLLAPIWFMFSGYAVRRIKKCQHSVLWRFFWFCFIILTPFTLFSSILNSTDPTRWLTNGFLCMFTLFLYICYHENGEPLSYVQSFFAQYPPAIVSIWQTLYAVTVYKPYI